MTSSYNDSAKSLARDKLRYFIENHSFAHPKRMQVVCFPGAEVDGEEALEVKEVYDRIGVQRKNIVGLERDPQRAARLRKANLGIEVVERDADEYFLHVGSRKFDVISLDYTGQQTVEENFSLEYIASRQLLSDTGILATEYFTGREGESMRRLLAMRMFNFMSGNHGRSISEYESAMQNLEDNLDEIADGKNLDKLREAITLEVVNIFSGGTINLPVVRHFFSDDHAKAGILGALAEEMEKEKEVYAARASKLNGFSIKRNLEYQRKFGQRNLERAYFNFRNKETMGEILSLMSEGEAFALLNSQMMAAQKSYTVRELERYAYTSNSGSNMVLDLFAFHKLPFTLAERARDLLRFKFSQERPEITLNPRRYASDKFYSRLSDFSFDFYKSISHNFPKRTELNPEPALLERNETEKMTKEVIGQVTAALEQENQADTDLMMKFGITKQQLAWCKAKITRGKKEQLLLTVGGTNEPGIN